MNTLIQAVETWVPDADGHLLVCGGGLYPGAVEFGAVSRSMCFGRGEGLPGRVWDEARPILLKDLQGGYFRRAAAAKKAGLASAAAMPVYFGDALKAVVVFFLRGDSSDAGAIELWHNDPRVTTDMTLLDGYYGATSADFVEASHETYAPRGSGLPGLAWQREGAVLIDDLGSHSRFLRGEAAVAAGLRRGLAIPCPHPGNDNYVLAFLSSAQRPIAQRVESWVPDAGAGALYRAFGSCAKSGSLTSGASVSTAGLGDDSIAKAYASGAPVVAQRAGDEPGWLGAEAAAAGLGGMIVLPLQSGGSISEALALYL